MIARQEEFYRTKQRGRLPAPVLEVVGDQELPDARPNEAQRRVLKDLARSLRPLFTARELVYLAGAVEVEANLARHSGGIGG